MSALVRSPSDLAAEIVYTVDPEALTAYALAVAWVAAFDNAGKSREKVMRTAAAILEHRGRPDAARALRNVHRAAAHIRTGTAA